MNSNKILLEVGSDYFSDETFWFDRTEKDLNTWNIIETDEVTFEEYEKTKEKFETLHYSLLHLFNVKQQEIKNKKEQEEQKKQKEERKQKEARRLKNKKNRDNKKLISKRLAYLCSLIKESKWNIFDPPEVLKNSIVYRFKKHHLQEGFSYSRSIGQDLRNSLNPVVVNTVQWALLPADVELLSDQEINLFV